jgi:hypothetical protein
MPLVASAFMISQAITGWCPPLPLLKALAFRSRAEIDKEKFALKVLRGDFDNRYKFQMQFGTQLISSHYEELKAGGMILLFSFF